MVENQLTMKVACFYFFLVFYRFFHRHFGMFVFPVMGQSIGSQLVVVAVMFDRILALRVAVEHRNWNHKRNAIVIFVVVECFLYGILMSPLFVVRQKDNYSFCRV